MDSDRILNGFWVHSQWVLLALSMDFGRILNGSDRILNGIR